MTTSASSRDYNRVTIFDTTLRDGEQSPGAAMDLGEKLRIARVLEELGVDVMEAGFPIASKGDFEAVNEIAKTIKNSTVCGLARAQAGDIERAAEAVKPAVRARIHTFISTSPLHMKHKLQMTPENVYQAVIDSVTLARKLCDDVEWSPEDGTRTEHDFLCRTVEAAIKAGARTINIPDTVGYTTPQEYADLIKMLVNRVPNIDKAILSTHCHNDLGLAVANSLAGVISGARQVECTINGLGERAGNAALEEIVMAMKVRHDLMPFVTNIQTEVITKASHLVSSITGFVVQPNKAIVGANAFAHESGNHQDATPSAPGCRSLATNSTITPRTMPSSASKPLPTARRKFLTKTSWRWWTTRWPARMTVSAFRAWKCAQARKARKAPRWKSQSTERRPRQRRPAMAPSTRPSMPSRRWSLIRPTCSFIRLTPLRKEPTPWPKSPSGSKKTAAPSRARAPIPTPSYPRRAPIFTPSTSSPSNA